jgi:hypothetical protein
MRTNPYIRGEPLYSQEDAISVTCHYVPHRRLITGTLDVTPVWVIIKCGWNSSVQSDTQLTYMIDIALTTEFSLAAGGAS